MMTLSSVTEPKNKVRFPHLRYSGVVTPQWLGGRADFAPLVLPSSAWPKKAGPTRVNAPGNAPEQVAWYPGFVQRWAIGALSAAALLLLVAMLVVRHVQENRVLASEPEPEPQPRAAPPRPTASSGSTTVGKTADDGALQGEVEARADLAAGVLGWKESGGYGYPAPRAFEAVGVGDILARDFGVRLTRTEHAGCMVPPDAEYESERFEAYNAVMKPAIMAKHGADVFDVADARAKAENDRRAEEVDRRHQKRDSADAGGRVRGHANPKCDPAFYVDKNGVRRVKPGCA